MCFIDTPQPVFTKISVRILLNRPSVYISVLISSSYSDDVTVEVIFFGESPDTRTISVNEEASASEEAYKAKL